jgi:hypothetical protein
MDGEGLAHSHAGFVEQGKQEAVAGRPRWHGREQGLDLLGRKWPRISARQHHLSRCRVGSLGTRSLLYAHEKQERSAERRRARVVGARSPEAARKARRW